MEVGDQLKKLNMTPDEVDRLSNAFKDEKFKEMLRDYAKELSDPENKKKYEEEIKLLEEERGNTIDFIHPEPFKALRTSLNGTQKCFINICANEKVGKPECKLGTSEDGRRGQQWSLPHSLHPGRPDTDPKGKKIMIYDVVFHPDTLHMASRNKRFMNMVLSTAIQGIQENFKVILDKNKVRELTIKYKGTPQPCVIRKPIPGYKAKERPAHPDPLAFPYPDEKRPTTATTPAQIKDSVDANPVASQIQSHKPKEPIVPKYTVKYRSFIDLQDFRYSRDSAQSPRPKEIVVTVDMPLLKSAAAASLEVKGKSLLLESEKPAYRLEVVLAYPVDEDKGEAKFNKQRGQLTITLPVLPSNETYDFEEERRAEEEERTQQKWEGRSERKGGRGVEERQKQQVRGDEKNEEEEKQWEQRGEDMTREDEERNDQRETERSKDRDKERQRHARAAQMEDFCNSQIPIAVSALPAMQPLPNQVHRPEEIRDVLVSEKAQETSASGNSSKMNAHLSEEDIDEDDLMTEQTFPVHHTSPPPVVLREIDEDRNERVISDHSTSAGFIFQNSLLYELD
uniref:Protein kintoun n=1 Tax=Myripristis murdjan TaxID=586833 RepID=A0A667YM52_9TELE